MYPLRFVIVTGLRFFSSTELCVCKDAHSTNPSFLPVCRGVRRCLFLFVCAFMRLSGSANYTAIHNLNVQRNRVGDAGAAAFAGALRVRQPGRPFLREG